MKKILFILFFIFTINSFSQENRAIKFELLNFSDKNYNDYAPTLYKDGIIFLSDRGSKGRNFHLFYSDYQTAPKKILLNNNNFILGPVAYDKTTNLILITSSIKNNYYQKSYIYINAGLLLGNRIKYIKKQFFIDEKKSELNRKISYNIGHPTLVNNKLLVLKTKNSKSFLNLYKISNGVWKKEQTIYKTNYTMLHPSFLNDNTIVFSTKRKGGKGGLDLYKIIKTNKKWSKPINLKEFNTKYDDFGLLYINEYEGYISSNRIDNKDHIFKFTIEH